MKKSLIIFAITFSFFINGETDLIRQGFMKEYDFDCTMQTDMGHSCGITYSQYIEKLYELEPLSKATSRKGKNDFRFKFYKLHSYNTYRDPKLSDDKFLYGPAVRTLNAMLLLNEASKKYGNTNRFIGLIKHSGFPKRFNQSNWFDLNVALQDDSVITNDSFNTLLNYGIPAAQFLKKKSEAIEIGFSGPVEEFSEEYNIRIRKRIEAIENETDGLLSLFTADLDILAREVLQNYLNYGELSIKKRFEKICTDIFDENQIFIKEQIEVNYLKDIDFCDENNRDSFITGIYIIDPEVLQNYNPSIYFNIWYQQFFPTYHQVDNLDKLRLSIGPEILFNAKYGVSSGLNIVEKLNDFKSEFQDTFYGDINSLDDIKKLIQGFVKYPSDVPDLKKLIYPPRNNREEQIYKSFEKYIATNEFQQFLKDAEVIAKNEAIAKNIEDNFSYILQDPVAENLINLKTAFEIVKACYESRLSYAVVYLNQNEYVTLRSKFNKNFKEASSKLSPEIKKKLNLYGFDNFVDWGVELSLYYADAGNLDFLADWTQDNEEYCRYYKRQLR